MSATDPIQEALLRAQELIESTVAEHRRLTSDTVLATGSYDRTTAEDVARELIGQVRHGLSITVPPDSTVAAAACTVLLAGTGGSGPGGPGAGFAVRVLCAPEAFDAGDLPDPAALGWQVRVTDGPLQDTVVTDGRSALVRSELSGRQEMSIIQAPAVARALESLFAAAWRLGVPLAEHRALGDREAIRRILDQLRAGSTDEQAAHELEVSLRTYRRRVAEIMYWLGASSRFQAGVRAAELGLLSPTPWARASV